MSPNHPLASLMSSQSRAHDTLFIDGRTLMIGDVVDVARHGRRVEIAPDALRRVGRCRQLVDVLCDRDIKVYGLTTGFGALRDIAIESDDRDRLQLNLIVSHAAGVGEPFEEAVVRAAILLRLNTLCRGNSGVRQVLIQRLAAMLNADVYPHVPSQGSVGCSGDLAPLSHLALAVIGHPEGKVANRDGRFVRLAEQPHPVLTPLALKAKEGLALNNGTQFMTAVACLTLSDALHTVRCAELGVALSLEADYGVMGAFASHIHAVRPHRWQGAIARRVREYCEGSQIMGFYLNSAHLNRALSHLELAHGEIIGRWEGAAAEDAKYPLGRIRSSLGLLRSQLETVRRQIVQMSSKIGAESPRAQITALEKYMAPLRLEASVLLQTIQQPMFPRHELHGKLEEQLIKIAQHLSSVVPSTPFVQDDYSFRCAPQVMACTVRALEHVASIVSVEINSATDNPLLFPPPAAEDLSPSDYREWLDREFAGPKGAESLSRCVIGGGNFHGQPIATALDYLAIALAEIGSISERRIAHLVDQNMSRGLPGFLIEGAGLKSGFMIPQYTAAALVSENKVLCHPASVDSIPTCANSEDHVSMGTIAARKAHRVGEHVRTVVAIEILAARQALAFREPLTPGTRLQSMVGYLTQRGFKKIEDDVFFAALIEKMCREFESEGFTRLLLPPPEVERP